MLCGDTSAIIPTRSEAHQQTHGMMGRMPSSYGRSIATAVFVLVLTISPYAHAANTTAFGINDPFTDAIQLWSAVLSSFDSLAHQFAAVPQLHQTRTVEQVLQHPTLTPAPVQSIGTGAAEYSLSVPTIYSIEPTSGTPGTSVAITGHGFTASNTILFGESSIPNVPIASWYGVECADTLAGHQGCHSGTNQSLAIALPSDSTSGKYNVSVENASGRSNVLTFTVVRTSNW
jgi:IPT/TIG domain